MKGNPVNSKMRIPDRAPVKMRDSLKISFKVPSGDLKKVILKRKDKDLL